MFGKLVISLFVLFVVLHQIDGSCFLYPCDDLISDAKCVNTTGKLSLAASSANTTNDDDHGINRLIANPAIPLFPLFPINTTRLLGYQIEFNQSQILRMLHEWDH